MNIFISYAWTDVPKRMAVVGALQQCPGLSVVYDKANFGVGGNLHQQTLDLLQSADAVVALITEGSVTSKYVMEELVRADAHRKTIFALVSETVSDSSLFDFIRNRLQIRFRESEFEQAVERLVTAVTTGTVLPPVVNRAHGAPYPPGRAAPSPDISFLQRSNLGRDIVRTVIGTCTVYQYKTSVQGQELVQPLFVAPNTYIPDDWTQAFVRGLAVALPQGAANGHVVEIGIGTGIVPLLLSRLERKFERYYGFDIDPIATKVADLNIDLQGLSNRVVVAGGGSLFEPEAAFELTGQYADTIVANVPQVPSISTGAIRDLFDYYPMPAGLSVVERGWAMRGLFLVCRILQASRSRLRNNGQVVLNIGGRPGLACIEHMVDQLGYCPKVLHKEIVRQDPETDISAFAHFQETERIIYEFYQDPEGRVSIQAQEAHNLLAAGVPCFHKVYVLQATLR